MEIRAPSPAAPLRIPARGLLLRTASTPPHALTSCSPPQILDGKESRSGIEAGHPVGSVTLKNVDMRNMRFTALDDIADYAQVGLTVGFETEFAGWNGVGRGRAGKGRGAPL
jgi:hypothetical protein